MFKSLLLLKNQSCKFLDLYLNVKNVLLLL